MIKECAGPEVNPTDLFTQDAISVLAERLATPLQIEHYAWRALEEAYLIGQKPVTPEIVLESLAQDMDGLESNLARLGYNVRSLSEALDARPAEIRSLLNGRLPSERVQEIQQKMLKLGIMASSH